MSVCSAMSQGYIGYDIQNELRAELLRRGIYKPVATVITQVTVDPYDESLYQPTKVIGRILTKEEAEAEEEPREISSQRSRRDTAVSSRPRNRRISLSLRRFRLLVGCGTDCDRRRRRRHSCSWNRDRDAAGRQCGHREGSDQCESLPRS
jgi:carbamate kinase